MLGTKQDILDRYNKVEKTADKVGRIIVCGRLRPSQELAVIRMADSQDSYVQLVSRVAASVRKIDDSVFTFPRNRGELDAVIDGLDAEGIEAAMTAFVKLHAVAEEAKEDDGPKA